MDSQEDAGGQQPSAELSLCTLGLQAEGVGPCALQPEGVGSFCRTCGAPSLTSERSCPPCGHSWPDPGRATGEPEEAKGPWTQSTEELLQPEACVDGGGRVAQRTWDPRGAKRLTDCRATQGFSSAVSVTGPGPPVVGRAFQTCLSIETS